MDGDEVRRPDLVATGEDADARHPQDDTHSEGSKGRVLSACSTAILIIGAVVVIIDLNPIWLAFALWGIVIALHPSAPQRRMIKWLLVPTLLPFIAAIVGLAFGSHPLESTYPYSWIIEGVGLFAICLATMMLIDVRTRMNIDRRFLIVSAFLLFEAAVVIQGWVSWYADLWLGTNLVPSNDAFMVFYILCSAMALALAVLAYVLFRIRLFRSTGDNAGGRHS